MLFAPWVSKQPLGESINSGQAWRVVDSHEDSVFYQLPWLPAGETPFSSQTLRTCHPKTFSFSFLPGPERHPEPTWRSASLAVAQPSVLDNSVKTCILRWINSLCTKPPPPDALRPLNMALVTMTGWVQGGMLSAWHLLWPRSHAVFCEMDSRKTTWFLSGPSVTITNPLRRRHCVFPLTAASP